MSRNEVLWCVYIFKAKIACPRVVDYADTRLSNFVIEEIRKSVTSFSYGAQIEFFRQKNKVEKLLTLSL